MRRRLDPYPAVSLRCTVPFLPGEHRPHLRRHRFGTPIYPCHATSTGKAFRGCSHFIMFRLPRLLDSQVRGKAPDSTRAQFFPREEPTAGLPAGRCPTSLLPAHHSFPVPLSPNNTTRFWLSPLNASGCLGIARRGSNQKFPQPVPLPSEDQLHATTAGCASPATRAVIRDGHWFIDWWQGGSFK